MIVNPATERFYKHMNRLGKIHHYEKLLNMPLARKYNSNMLLHQVGLSALVSETCDKLHNTVMLKKFKPLFLYRECCWYLFLAHAATMYNAVATYAQCSG